jgi:hypothetical protein
MSQIPLSTIVIAIAMLAFSVVIVSRIGGKISLSRPVQAVLLVSAAAALLVGIYLHLGQTPADKPFGAGVARQEKPARESFTFTFSPGQVRWGDQVEIQVPFSAESITVYLNGMPLPKRLSNGGRTIRVTIPSGAKTGYLDLERDGSRARATSPISISP